MTTILQEKMLLKKDNIRTRLEVTGSNSNKIKKEMALLEKLDLAVDKDASDMCGRVGLGTSNITAHWGLTPLKKYKLFKWGIG